MWHFLSRYFFVRFIRMNENEKYLFQKRFSSNFSHRWLRPIIIRYVPAIYTKSFPSTTQENSIDERWDSTLCTHSLRIVCGYVFCFYGKCEKFSSGSTAFNPHPLFERKLSVLYWKTLQFWLRARRTYAQSMSCGHSQSSGNSSCFELQYSKCRARDQKGRDFSVELLLPDASLFPLWFFLAFLFDV